MRPRIIDAFITAPIVLLACQEQATRSAAPDSASAATSSATSTAARRVPESVFPVFKELLGVLKSSSAGGPIHLRRLDTEVQRDTNGKTLVVTTLELAIPAADALQATQRYDALREAIRQSPWCVELRPTGTKVTSDGRGLLVPDLTVLADPARVSPTELHPRGGASSGQSPEALALTLAASPVIQLGQITSSVRTVTPEPGVTEAVYRFRSAGPTTYGLEKLKIFFQELDSSRENYALSAIHLVPARGAADLDAIASWQLDVELTVRD